MVEFLGFGPVHGVRLAHDLAPLPRAQDPTVVTAPGGADKARADTGGSGDMGSGTGAGAGADTGMTRRQSRQPADTAQGSAPGTAANTSDSPLREDTPAGPSPAFQASILDIRTDLRLALARAQAQGYAPAGTEPAPSAKEDDPRG